MTQLLLLPGLACDAAVWEHQARRLAQSAAIQIADYGSSDTIKKMAESVLRMAPARFAMAGHSMGGRIAFEVVRLAPERVAGLALLDTAYKAFAGGEVGARERAERLRLVDLARTQGMKVMARDWVRNMVHPSRLADKTLLDSIIEMFGRKTPEIFAGQIKALLDRPDATPILGTIRCPTLVLCGREDTWSVVATHEEMAALIPGGKLVIIEECGHMAPMEKPEAVTAALASWLAGLS
ncbi:MAG TPA: alpha/beta hydrolase [Verrucomicrobiae bacterium]|nr:alpha/beta hydrolase [Verrucomicrobiae bacterium]